MYTWSAHVGFIATSSAWRRVTHRLCIEFQFFGIVYQYNPLKTLIFLIFKNICYNTQAENNNDNVSEPVAC